MRSRLRSVLRRNWAIPGRPQEIPRVTVFVLLFGGELLLRFHKYMRGALKGVIQVCFGLRFRLLLLVVLVCAPLVLLTLHTASEERRRAIANWPQRAQRMAQLVS